MPLLLDLNADDVAEETAALGVDCRHDAARASSGAALDPERITLAEGAVPRLGVAGLPSTHRQAWTSHAHAARSTPHALPPLPSRARSAANDGATPSGLQALKRDLDALRARLRLAEAALDCVRCAVFLVDARASIHFANRAARRLLAEGDALQGHGGVLAARINGDVAALAALIERTASCSGPVGGAAGKASMAIRRGVSRPPLVAVAVSACSCSRGSGRDARLVQLYVADPAERAGVGFDLLRDAFGLTDRESSVVLATLRVGSLPAAAAELGIALTTACSHLQHVFDKTGTRNQVALAQMLASLGALPDPAPTAAALA
jgi:DNA-binding CsgD family transcriptional regulator/PAS domain-containing protein